MWELLYKKGLVWKGKSDNSVRKVCAPGQSLSFCSSAWNDGKIRAFVPATGEPMYEINNAHNLGVTAIAATSDCKQIISGGGDGQVICASKPGAASCAHHRACELPGSAQSERELF